MTKQTNELAIIPEFQFSVFKLPEIEFNFDALDKSLDDTLAKYSNVVVTQESLPDDKKLAQELNAQAKAISNARIAKVKELAKPVDVFQVKMKALESKVLSVHKTINEQVKQFEELKLREIAAELDTLIKQEWESQGVAEQFRKATYADLIKLTSITGKGNLTAKTANEVKERVGKDKALQSQTQIRLLELENICYKNGMAAPLTESHVKSFLFESDELYNSALQQLIQSELEREKRAVEAHRAKLEAEAKAKAQADIAVQQAQEQAREAERELIRNIRSEDDAASAQQEATKQPEPVAERQTGITRVTCVFESEFWNAVPNEALIAKFEQLLAEAGFKTLKTINIER